MNKHEKPTIEQWRQILDTAVAIKELTPWELLWDNDLIMIQLPEQKEPVFCCVMGKNGECYGLSFYFGYKALRSYYRMLEAPEGEPAFISMSVQDCITCYYGDREELTEEERGIIKQTGHKFRGRNEWPFFKSMRPGYYPWFINRKEAGLLIRAAEQFVGAYTAMTEEGIYVDYEADEVLYRHFDAEKDAWVNGIADVPSIPVDVHKFIIHDELFVARLKSHKKNKSTVELDLFHVPAPILESRNEAPYLPRMCLLVDSSSGKVYEQNLLERDTPDTDGVFDILQSYINRFGMPHALRVRDGRVSDILEDFCAKAGIRLVTEIGCPMIDEFLESFDEFM